MMPISEVLSLLPHRYPFLLVDRILDHTPQQSLRALKNVTVNEAYFQGHFPERPVMPGVLMIEAMAQAAAVLAYVSYDYDSEDGLFYLAGVDKARFKRVVEPGDQLELTVTVLKCKRDLMKFMGEARVAGELACSAEFMSVRKGN